jgi:hypothetical protein
VLFGPGKDARAAARHDASVLYIVESFSVGFPPPRVFLHQVDEGIGLMDKIPDWFAIQNQERERDLEMRKRSLGKFESFKSRMN